MRHHGRGILSKPVADAVAEMIAAKAEKGVSATYLADLRYRLGAFQAAFHCSVNAIVADDLRAYLDGLTLAPRRYNNTVAACARFSGSRKIATGSRKSLICWRASKSAGKKPRRSKSSPLRRWRNYSRIVRTTCALVSP